MLNFKQQSGFGRWGSHQRRSPKTCTYFYQHGTCSFGERCKFSHDTNADERRDCRSRGRDRGVEETSNQSQAKSDYNSWRSLIRHPPKTADVEGMLDVWSGALKVLNGDDRDMKQIFPKDLVDDNYQGLTHVGALLEKRADTGNCSVLIEVVRSFLLVITHTSLVDCLSVDTYVGSLYSFMSGTNGKRAIPFFQHICELLAAERADTSPTVSPDRQDSTLVALLTALSELLQRESRVRYNDDLVNLIDSFEVIAQLISEDSSQVVSDLIKIRVADFRATVSRGADLLQGPTDIELTDGYEPREYSLYPRSMVVPGQRHDNDPLDIVDVRIFPTRAEILSDAEEFLPSTDPDQPHFLASKQDRFIDTQFRLFRHDIFGQLNEDLGALMKHVTENPDQITVPHLHVGDTRSNTYTDAFVSYLMLDRKGILQAQISFTCPQAIRARPLSERRRWWEEARRLEEGVLLSLIWTAESSAQLLFLVVSGRSTDPKTNGSLLQTDSIATITAKATIQDQKSVETLLVLSCQKTHGVLLEFPNILPATFVFVPVLESLQGMKRLGRLPFREYILPDPVDGPRGQKIDIQPPLYARKAGFVFSMASISNSEGTDVGLHPLVSGTDPSFVSALEEKTGLDRGQCLALMAALTREFAFIQGPPGTGKTFLGVKLIQVLLDAMRKANTGPIVVVCYTNHALDQFLEHLIRIGISKIIRIGGQSRSKLLEDHNLRSVTRTETKSRHEGWQAAKAYESLEDCESRSKQKLRRIHALQKRLEWKNVERYLAKKYPRIHSQFDSDESDSFTQVGRDPFDIWMAVVASSNRSVMQSEGSCTEANLTSIIEKAERNVQSLSHSQRRMLIDIWTCELQQDLGTEFFEIVKDAEESQRKLTNVHEETNRRVLQEADIIGLTTSGLAKNISTLQRVRCKVVICEEAGEVMEPHVVSALLPFVEHFVQIGDHQQLRPTINNFKALSLESQAGSLYQLDRSQFERLSIGQRGRPSMPIAQLHIQRRMRPDISRLIRGTIYPDLIDHSTTLQLPDVIGMRKNVFWLHHHNLEDQVLPKTHHEKTKSNAWEVAMVHGLVRHVIRQGVYNSSDIAVLTPYTGQLQKLRAAMRNDFEIVLSERDQDALLKDGIAPLDNPVDNPLLKQEKTRKPLQKKQLSDLLRVATVDNFQGEEAKIIIVSLVRSNEKRKVGFLKTTNRINVLLSRAQHGIYLIGNTDTYSNVQMWQDVINLLHEKDSVGTSLGLCCPRHRDTTIQIQQPDDFAKLSPEGGCREACMDRLPECGHRCQARCHSQAMHKVFRCEQPCQRRHTPCNHPCQKRTCGEDCGVCMVPRDNVSLVCGHSKDNVPCFRSQSVKDIRCEVEVEKVVPGCRHKVHTPCSQDVDEETYRCPVPCGTTLPCGHPCSGSCGSCNSFDNDGKHIVDHLECNRTCGRRFGTCNHNCSRRCHSGSECGLCTSACEVACKHSRCTRKCHEACAPCIERCTWSCPHKGECTLPCSAPCDRLPCNRRCTMVLPCGHQCPGLCGEACLPANCQTCGMKLDAQVDMIELKDYGEIDVDSTPIIALTCGHFFTAETLDGMIGLKDVYNIDPTTNNILGVKDSPFRMAPSIPKCPHCQRPIQQYTTGRYNRLINWAVIDEMTKRFIVTGQSELQKSEKELSEMEIKLDKSRAEVTTPKALNRIDSRPRTSANVGTMLEIRYKALARLRSSIIELQQRTAERHQPANRLREATLHSLRRDEILEDALKALALQDAAFFTKRDHQITLGTKLMEIKIDCITIEDKFRVLSAMKSADRDLARSLKFTGGTPNSLAYAFFQMCEDFMASCNKSALPKLAVQCSLCYARIARFLETSRLSDVQECEKVTKHRERARTFLEKSEKYCEQGFSDSETLLRAVEDLLKLLQKVQYSEVTADELDTIKIAMVSGSRGIASHSGHWYNCANGHPFAIGECGMPMELAQCPECGATIGGEHHQAVSGVTRAMSMES